MVRKLLLTTSLSLCIDDAKRLKPESVGWFCFKVTVHSRSLCFGFPKFSREYTSRAFYWQEANQSCWNEVLKCIHLEGVVLHGSL